jgi:quercetin dioxygenase-like cupin family protein
MKTITLSIGGSVPIYCSEDADEFQAHGSRFASFLSTARGASSLCAWRLDVAPGQPGVSHRPDHEEVILLLSGRLEVTLDGERTTAEAGSVIHVPAGSEFRVDGGPHGAAAWVTTTAGLTATIGDTTMAPPWAQ